MEKIKRFFKDEEGVTAIEYGLIAALIAVACVAIWGATGDELVQLFTDVNTNLAAR